jgi:uncharacterized protein (TIGR02301 family)
MKRARLPLVACAALLTLLQPAAAQNFFERLFGPPPGQHPPGPPPPGQPLPGQPAPPPQFRTQPQFRPQPQYQPQRRPQPQQQRSAPQPQQPQQQAEPAPSVEPPAAPFEKELLRLAEIIGSLALLRPLCSAPDGAEWSKRMQTLLEAEGTTSGRKERLAGAYNRGYQAYSLTYRACTASAQEASARYLREGELLARNIAGRYGG